MIQKIIDSFREKLSESFPTTAVYLGEEVVGNGASFFQIKVERVSMEKVKSMVYQIDLTLEVVYTSNVLEDRLKDEVRVLTRLGQCLDFLTVDGKRLRMDSFEKGENLEGLSLLFPLTFMENRESVEIEDSKIEELEVRMKNGK